MTEKDTDYSQEYVLVVDDEPRIRDSIEMLLSSLGFKTDSASNGLDALKNLSLQEYTFLLTDMNMPDMDGMELMKRAKEDFPGVSIIAMTGYSDEYNYVDVINAGASDFIKKPFEIDELEAKIRRVISERNLRNELKRLIITDSLTGLYNQRHFYTRLNEEVKRATRQGNPLSLILLDLDNFKSFNDTHGHLAGDDVLRNVGKIIHNCIRDGVDSGYRYGGDEFAIILIDAELCTAKEIGERIQEALKEDGKVTASLGFSRFSKGMTAEEMVSIADKNLYKDKIDNQRKNNVR